MTVRIIATGNVETFGDSYAQRLLDMGIAVPTEPSAAEETMNATEPEAAETVTAAEVAETEKEPEEEPEKKPAARQAARGKKNR